MRPISICMFTNLFPPIVSGSSTFSWELSRRLAARGHQVSVVTARAGDAKPHEEIDGVAVHRMPAVRLPRLTIAHNFKWMTYTFTPRNLSWLRTLFGREDFDVIHQQNHIFDTILSSPRLAARFNLPLVITIHTYAQHTNRLYNMLLKILDGIARKIILDRADVVVSPDPAVKRYVETRHHVENSPLVPYGIESKPPRPGDVDALRRRYAEDFNPLMLSLGHVHPMRDRIDLITAMPIILQQFPRARLLIVGEIYTQEPVALVRKLKLEEQVVFVGPVPHSMIPALFEISTLEAHTFKGPYPGPGIASMEAMAAGLPVITGEIPREYNFEHLHDWENIVMVPVDKPYVLANALLRLLKDDHLRRRIGESARRTMAEHYSWDAVCSAYEDVYSIALDRHKPS